MAKRKPSDVNVSAAADSTAAGDGPAVDEAALAEAREIAADAEADAVEKEAAAKEAREVADGLKVEVEALAVAVVTGPRVHLEGSNSFRSVAPDEVRERRLRIDGLNYEQVAEVVDQGETIWSYRQMPG